MRRINKILDDIKAEIVEEFGGCAICEWDENYDYDENDISEWRWTGSIKDILDIIDEYKQGKE